MWYVSISSLFLSLSSSSRRGDVVIDGGKSSFASLLRFDRAADLTTTRVRRKRAELLRADAFRTSKRSSRGERNRRHRSYSS